MAHLFQCDSCKLREPEVSWDCTLTIKLSYYELKGEEKQLELCSACQELVAKKLAILYQQIERGTYG